MSTDLYVLGTGIRVPIQFTPETRQALSLCKCVFVLHADATVIGLVEDLGPKVVDVASMYEGKPERRAAYRAIAERVVEEAAHGGPVAFLVHGHPLFLVSASEYIIDLARVKGLVTAALPGVSSFDTLLCDLGIDLGYGVQLFDTTTMLDQGWVPNPRIPALFFQLATTRDTAIVYGDRSGTVLSPVMDALVPLYGEDHEVLLIESSASVFEPSSVRALRIGDIASGDVDLTRRPTMYVAPILEGP